MQRRRSQTCCASTGTPWRPPCDGAARPARRPKRLRPDVAFIDLNMPEMDGYELAQRLRACLGSERHAWSR